VRALDDTVLAVVSGARFVAAVSGFSATSTAVEQNITDYLSRETRLARA
jgi:hypothetical protein